CCAYRNIERPVSDHAGGIPEQATHRAPTVRADRLHQRLLCPAPLWLSVLDKLEALLRERDDADTLVSAGATVDQAIPLQRSKRARDAGSVQDLVTAKRRNRDLLFGADQPKLRKLRNVHPCIPQEVVVHA